MALTTCWKNAINLASALLQVGYKEALCFNDFLESRKTPVSQIEEIKDIWRFSDKTELAVMSFTFCDLQLGENKVSHGKFGI